MRGEKGQGQAPENRLGAKGRPGGPRLWHIAAKMPPDVAKAGQFQPDARCWKSDQIQKQLNVWTQPGEELVVLMAIPGARAHRQVARMWRKTNEMASRFGPTPWVVQGDAALQGAFRLQAAGWETK
jgi:hypothetical protein